MRICLSPIELLALTLTGQAARKTSEVPFTTFTDVAAKAGLTEATVYGGIDRKRYIIEANGCGVAFYDYDQDGWMDVLVSSEPGLDQALPRKRKEPTKQLYRNNRNGTFTSMTREVRTRTHWMGVGRVSLGGYTRR